jgi:manganese/zinc-transporting P-type ATPase C
MSTELMDAVIRSAAGGRLRLSVPWLKRRPSYAREVEARLSDLEGVGAVEVFWRTGNVVVWMDSPTVQNADLVQRLSWPPCDSAPSVQPVSRPRSEAHTGEAARLVVGGAVLAVLGVRSLVLRRPPVVRTRAAGVLNAVAVFTGYPFFRGALHTVTGRTSTGTDALVTAATLASLVMRQNVVALTVLWLLNIGEFLQALTLRRTRRAIEELLTVGEERVWLVQGEIEVEVGLEQLAVGDVVAVYEHHKLPVDGEVVTGEALVHQAAVTGEALPVVVRPGSQVYAGTIVTDGSLRVRATKVGRDTVVGRIVERVEAAQADRAPIQTVATRFSQRFVPVSLAMATLTYLLTRDARRAMTMLLIACPCAAGLSTPTAISAAIGNGARRGTLIKGGAHLESAGKVGAVVFDKTGTLTLGRPLVTNVVALTERFDSEQVLALAASGEIHARHPLAQAVVQHTAERHIEIPLHEQCEVVLGMGMRADLQGNRLLVGSANLMAQYGVLVTPQAQTWVHRLRGEGATAVCLAHNDDLIGILGVSDAIRSDASVMLAKLRALGVERIVMTTGDAPEAATSVAEHLGIDEYYAEALPETKLAVVRRLQGQGYAVAMVGDGTNDAPALALADISIAMGTHGSHVAIETADITLAGTDLSNVTAVVQLSRRTLQVVRQNYGLAIGVNVLGLLAGAGGGLSPVLAALLHNASSVAVVFNSARLVRYDPRPGGVLQRRVLQHAPLSLHRLL